MDANRDSARTHALLTALKVEIGLCEAEQEPLTLVIAGVDRLGADRREIKGDPLVRVLQVIAGVLREGDLCLRLGPSEFAILLPAAERLAAAMVCQRVDGVVRAALAELSGVQVSFSFGLTEHAEGISPQQMVSAAEADLASARADSAAA
jgi:GGDEF domain-containing protein